MQTQVNQQKEQYTWILKKIQQWVDTYLLVLKRIGTNENESDGMTKNVARDIFYMHIYYLIRKILQEYATKHKDIQLQVNTLKYQVDI